MGVEHCATEVFEHSGEVTLCKRGWEHMGV